MYLNIRCCSFSEFALSNTRYWDTCWKFLRRIGKHYVITNHVWFMNGDICINICAQLINSLGSDVVAKKNIKTNYASTQNMSRRCYYYLTWTLKKLHRLWESNSVRSYLFRVKLNVLPGRMKICKYRLIMWIVPRNILISNGYSQAPHEAKFITKMDVTIFESYN